MSKLVASQHDAEHRLRLLRQPQERRLRPVPPEEHRRRQDLDDASPATCPRAAPCTALPKITSIRTCCSVGTEFGLFVTLDGGKKWHALKSGLPTIAVKRPVHPAEDERPRRRHVRPRHLRPRRLLAAAAADAGALAQKAAVLFPVATPCSTSRRRSTAGAGKAFLGASFYTADNPPFGATFTYYLKDALKTRKQKRKDAEKAAEKAGKPIPYPTPEELRLEAEEEAPGVSTSWSPMRRAMWSAPCSAPRARACTASRGTCAIPVQPCPSRRAAPRRR